MGKGRSSGWRNALRVAGLAALVAVGLRATVVGTYYVPSESMLPTLLVGDHIAVDKSAFGAPVPFTGWRTPGRREPERGDVVIFDLGRRSATDLCPVDRCPDYPVEEFVKRIAGLPGDVVEVRAGRLLLNGSSVPVEPEGTFLVDDAGVSRSIQRERLGGDSHRILDDPADPGIDQVRIRVPEDRYFLLGDNRDDSSDSRSWGTVHRRQVVGPVTRVYWSWNNREPWVAMLDPSVWWRLLTTETRWGRAGMRVE